MKEFLKKNLDVLESNIQAIENLASTVKQTVGPKGLDVMLVDEYGCYKCTNDGVEILDNVQVNHPVSKLAIEVAKSQEARVGDGTTSAVIFTEALLKASYKKIKEGAKIQRLISGIEFALEKTLGLLEKNSFKIQNLDDEKLLEITKIAARGDEDLASLLIETIKKTRSFNLKDFDYDLSGHIFSNLRAKDEIIEGYLLKKRSHFIFDTSLENIKVVLLEGSIEPEAMPTEAISTGEGLKKFESNIQLLLESSKKLLRAGVKAVFSSGSILPKLEEFLVKEGIFVLSHITKSDLKRFKLFSGAQILSREKFISLDQDTLIKAAGTFVNLYWNEKLQAHIIQGSKFKVASLVLSSETKVALEEKERIAIDAAKSLQSAINKGYVLGEGLAEMNLLPNLDKLEHSLNKEDFSFIAGIVSMKESVQALFKQILENAGLEADEYIKQINFSSENRLGVNLDNLQIIDLYENGILDPLEVKLSALKIATEISLQVLKINRVLQSK